MSGLNKTVKFKDKGGSAQIKMGVVIDEVYIIVGDYKHLIQQIRRDQPYWDGSQIGYRTCYYTFEAKGKNIKFGQYTQFLTEKEYTALLAMARDKGWSIFGGNTQPVL
jgi:hypothetical protein